MQWIKITPGCAMPRIGQTVAIVTTELDNPTCAYLSPDHRTGKPYWIYDQTGYRVQRKRHGTLAIVTHWCAIEPPKE